MEIRYILNQESKVSHYIPLFNFGVILLDIQFIVDYI